MTNSRGKRGRALQADGRFAVAMVAAVALLGCVAVLGIVIGSTSVGLPDVLALAFGAPAEQTAANVIWNIRLPRFWPAPRSRRRARSSRRHSITLWPAQTSSA